MSDKQLPSSKEEKKLIEALMVEHGEDPGLPHWLYVHELKALLNELEDDNVVMVNRIGNLAIYRPSPAENIYEADEFIAAISFLWGIVERYDEEYDDEEE